jgi:hypothetical protein
MYVYALRAPPVYPPRISNLSGNKDRTCLTRSCNHILEMTFTNNSCNDNEVSKPLLGNSPHHESDEEQGCIPSPLLTLAVVYDDDVEASCQEAAEDDSQWWGNFVSSVALPALLLLQFGMAFFRTPVQGTTGLPWSFVNFTIVMFVITAALYHRTVQDCQITCLVAHFLPEILMDIVLGLVLYGHVVPAFMLLASSTLCLPFLAFALNKFVNGRCCGWTSHLDVSEKCSF